MNSFKKIALAMVAAMTLGTMVATPASANTMSVVATTWNAAKVVSGVVTPGYDTPATAGTALTTAIVRPVPADNTIDNADVIKLEATVVAGTNVTATATNATLVSALHSTAAPVGASSGSSTLTVATGTGTTATFYVYTKTTAIGTVVITNGPVTLTYYVQGTAGLINNLTVSAPSAGAAGTKQDIVVTATDVFGNKVSNKSITATVFASTAVMDTATVTTGLTLADFGTATFKATLPTTGTRSLITFAPTTSTDAVAAAVVGLTAPTLSPFAEITVRDLVSELASEKAAKDAALAAKAVSDAAVLKAAADAVTAKAAADKALADAKVAADAALAAAVKVETDKAAAAKLASDAALAAKDAQIAKLTADNAAALKSIKDAFNKLARQWNAKNPKAKVTLVK
jgi:trimeric autotransporter adhesin